MHLYTYYGEKHVMMLCKKTREPMTTVSKRISMNLQYGQGGLRHDVEIRCSQSRERDGRTAYFSFAGTHTCKVRVPSSCIVTPTLYLATAYVHSRCPVTMSLHVSTCNFKLLTSSESAEQTASSYSLCSACSKRR